MLPAVCIWKGFNHTYGSAETSTSQMRFTTYTRLLFRFEKNRALCTSAVTITSTFQTRHTSWACAKRNTVDKSLSPWQSLPTDDVHTTRRTKKQSMLAMRTWGKWAVSCLTDNAMVPRTTCTHIVHETAKVQTKHASNGKSLKLPSADVTAVVCEESPPSKLCNLDTIPIWGWGRQSVCFIFQWGKPVDN